MRQGIHLILWLDEDQRIRKFELTGHAGYAEYGQDIVCAAISALSISAVNGLEHFLPQQPEVQVRDSDGYLTCSLPELDPQTLEQAQWILKTMVLGIEEIQQSYGQEYVNITQRRWTPC
ncbi:ribosomal-processing cysteine protease Prp [Desulfitobacterium metallireducens]|uniref:ribosomal-processing cysteine protease Prp n=1 Tax=Desulfitobacterium metallireducens TaxID=142877 RepID=UPI0002F4AAA2|nr:ribosomal-processing cysteine protease Prp [Desulfitobacterium metallireducens]